MEHIKGLTEDEIAHLSPRQRERLAAERKGGASSVKHHQKALEYNREQQAKADEHEAGKEGRLGEALDPDYIIARRTAEHKLAADRAAAQQEINAKVNADKEAQDQREAILGREAAAPTVSDHVADQAAELVRQRVEQAREIGLVEGSEHSGHPDSSDEQAEAVRVNSEKEVQDAVDAGNVTPPQNAVDGVVAIQLAQFDDDGNYIGPASGAPVEEAEEGNGAAENGQPNGTSEPTASELAIEGLGAPPKAKRGRVPAAGRAIGSGPASE